MDKRIIGFFFFEENMNRQNFHSLVGCLSGISGTNWWMKFTCSLRSVFSSLCQWCAPVAERADKPMDRSWYSIDRLATQISRSHNFRHPFLEFLTQERPNEICARIRRECAKVSPQQLRNIIWNIRNRPTNVSN